MNPGGNLANSSLPVPVAQPTPVMPYRMAGPLGSRIFLGVLVATIGVVLQAAGSAIPFLSSYGSNLSLPDFIRSMWIQAIVGAFGTAVFVIGLFLVFWSIAGPAGDEALDRGGRLRCPPERPRGSRVQGPVRPSLVDDVFRADRADRAPLLSRRLDSACRRFCGDARYLGRSLRGGAAVRVPVTSAPSIVRYFRRPSRRHYK